MRTRTFAVTAGLLLTLTACGDGGETGNGAGTEGGGAGENGSPTTGGDTTSERETAGAEGGGEEMTSITMGVLPIVPSAALQLGIDEGIFEEHGFDVSLESGQGGAALLPAVVSGDMEFAISNPMSIMVAQDQGLDVRMVTGYSHALPEGDDITSVWSAADSDITSPADLEGRTVAVNTLRTMGEVSIREVVRQAGGDAESIQFVEMGFPDMPAALENGNIEVAWVPEPFQTILENSGAQFVTYNYQETMPGVATMSVITSGSMADSDPELVESFVAAVDEVTAYAQDNPDQVRETLTTFLEMDEELAEQVLIEDFGAEMDEAAMERLAELAQADGILQEPVDMDEFMPDN